MHEYFGDEVVSSLVDHNSQICLVCNENLSDEKSNETSQGQSKNNSDLFGKIGQVMKMKSQDLKGKLFEYIVNPSASANNFSEKKNEKVIGNSKKERNTMPVFSIDDDQDAGSFSKRHVIN